jgi:translation elongation factor EF-G
MTREHNKIFLRETVQGSGSGEGKIVRQRGASREYAHVRVGIRPAERGRGVVMAWDAGPSVPAHFANSVLIGIQDALTAGAAGLEVTDVNVSVEDGSYQDADSNEEAFREAAQAATLEAIQQAGPIVLEAMSLMMITLPANQVEVAELAVGQRGGEATPAVPKENGFKALAANVPSVAVSELIAELLGATGGNMAISSRANGYRPRMDRMEGGTSGMIGGRRR